MFIKYIAPVGILCIVGALLQLYGTLNVPCSYIFDIINTGFLRALAMISLGAIVNEVAEYIESRVIKKSMMLTVMEVAAYALVFLYMAIGKSEQGKGNFDGSVLFFLAFAVAITVSEKSLLNGCIPDKIGIISGKFSMVMFMNHLYWLRKIPKFFSHIGVTSERIKWIAIVISILTSVIVYFLGSTIQKRLDTSYRRTKT